MWSDTLLALERAHLLRLLAWGAMSVIAGTGLLASLMVRRTDSSLLRNFAIQTSVWGVISLAIAGRGLFRAADRDLG
jgi:low temperature requirement protein LtrA